MPLTLAQLATLKTAIIADPVAGPLRAAGDSFSLGVWCNNPSTTLAWQSSVAAQVSDEAATYTLFDSIIAGKRDSWGVFSAQSLLLLIQDARTSVRLAMSSPGQLRLLMPNLVSPPGSCKSRM